MRSLNSATRPLYSLVAQWLLSRTTTAFMYGTNTELRRTGEGSSDILFVGSRVIDRVS